MRRIKAYLVSRHAPVSGDRVSRFVWICVCVCAPNAHTFALAKPADNESHCLLLGLPLWIRTGYWRPCGASLVGAFVSASCDLLDGLTALSASRPLALPVHCWPFSVRFVCRPAAAYHFTADCSALLCSDLLWPDLTADAFRRVESNRSGRYRCVLDFVDSAYAY